MLTFENKGRPVAIIKNGKYHNKIIFLCEENQKCCDKCSPECVMKKDNYCCGGCLGDSCTLSMMIKNKPLDMVNEQYIRCHKKKISGPEMGKLKRALQNDDEPQEQALYDIYLKTKNETNRLSKTNFLIYDDGILIPLPNFHKSERSYVCGPSDSGKSYYTKKQLIQLRKVHPDKKIFIFSDVQEDPEIDCIPNLTRFKIDDGLLNKKFDGNKLLPKLAEAICIFDDVDNMMNAKLGKVISNLRDTLLVRGRHQNISVICTNHLMTNYKDTRTILNECSSITFFPRSGATHAIQYTLKKYCNMGAQDIQKVLKLPSRWVTVYKCYPMYICYEKGIYIL